MRIILASTYVPFVKGGARFIVEWLEQKLIAHGHDVERFYFPFVETPDDLLTQTAALRLVDLTQASDRLIAFRPPSHVLRHPHKFLWFIHHIRAYYDLWDSEFAPLHTPQEKALRSALHQMDTTALGEAQGLFTNSQVVSDRLARFNGVASTPLYPPILEPERFRCDGYGDEVVIVCRLEAHKRQMLLVEAMAHTQSGVRLRLCGRGSSDGYGRDLAAAVERLGLADKVILEDRWISETEKADRLAGALATVYAPKDEDSYGYPSLEAAHAQKAVLTTTDSGGVLELVQDGRNGFVCTPEPKAIAERLDRLFLDRALAQKMGEANARRIAELSIDWDHVVEVLTA